MPTSYKNFSSFNTGMVDLIKTERANKCTSLLNLSSQIPGLIKDLPQNWARGLSGVIQQEYDENGHITDVTPSQAISTVDSLLYDAKLSLLNIKESMQSIASTLPNVDATANMTERSLARSNQATPVATENNTLIYLGVYYHNSFNVKVYVQKRANSPWQLVFTPSENPVSDFATRAIASVAYWEGNIFHLSGAYIRKAPENPNVARFAAFSLQSVSYDASTNRSVLAVLMDQCFVNRFDISESAAARAAEYNPQNAVDFNEGWNSSGVNFTIGADISAEPAQYLGLIDPQDAIDIVDQIIDQN